MSEIALAFRDFSFSKNKISDSSMVSVHGGLASLDNSLTTILQRPTSMEAALAIPQMWHNINSTTEDIERRHLESRILRACVMWAALSLNKWVENTIDRVQSGKASQSWVNKLVSQIDLPSCHIRHINGPNPGLPTTLNLSKREPDRLLMILFEHG